MHEIGKSVVYGQNGVMTIVDIRNESVEGKERLYYVLRGVRSSLDSLIFVPCDNGELVGTMRPLATKEEIDEAISYAASAPEQEWIDDIRARSSHFKRIIDTGTRGELLGMILSARRRAKKREAEGARGNLSDEIFIRKAEDRLFSEMAIVLGIDYGEVEEYITKRLNS